MIYVAAGLVVGALVAMASGRVDPLLSVLVALILAGILGVAPADQLAAGLSNPGVITVAAMLIIAKGIVQTGVVSRATWTGAQFARFGAWILAPCLVTVCGVAYLLLRS